MKKTVIIRGAGDLASGIIAKLYNCNFNVIALEISNPTTIRRKVAFSQVLYEEDFELEGIKASYVKDLNHLDDALKKGVAVIVDEHLDILNKVKPYALVDAILAKKNLGTNMDMANIVIGVGPGFEATKDVHAVIETKRGHNLGRIYYKGKAFKNTSIPGLINGYGKERVIHANDTGEIKVIKDITSIVDKGEVIAKINDTNVYASIDGLVRGMIRDKTVVNKGLKIADIDPRLEQIENCFTISDKARAIGGGVLEAILKLGGEINE